MFVENPPYTDRCVKGNPFVLCLERTLSSATTRGQSPQATANWLDGIYQALIVPGTISPGFLAAVTPTLAEDRLVPQELAVY